MWIFSVVLLFRKHLFSSVFYFIYLQVRVGMEVVDLIRKIAAILQSPQPNQQELRQRENALKKFVGKFDPLLLIHECKCSLIELVLSLQLIERSVKSRGLDDRFHVPLWKVLAELLIDQNTSPVVRRHALVLSAVLLIKVTRPPSVIEFMKLNLSEIPEIYKKSILGELPAIAPLKEMDKQILTQWAVEVFPLITQNIDLMERWVDFTQPATIIRSGILESFHTQLEDVLIACAKKSELSLPILNICMQVLDRDLVFASRLFGEVTVSGESVSGGLLVLTKIKEFIQCKQIPLDTRLRVIEHTLGFFENKSIVLSIQVLDVLLVLSAFPPDHPKARDDQSSALDDESPEGMLRRFLEIRQEVRHILRSAVAVSETFNQDMLALVMYSLSNPDWRIAESVLHAFSAQQKRFGSDGGRVTEHLFHKLLGNEVCVHRAVCNGIVICGTTFFQSMNDSEIVLKVVLNCLAGIDTLDETGWLPFRAKQDNSGVVLLHNCSANKAGLDSAFFLKELIPKLPDIKSRIFYRDPFRQTRNIFVRSVSGIILKRSSDPGRDLVNLLPILCDDCQDVSEFMAVARDFKSFLFPLVLPKLELFLSQNAVGIESLVSVFSDLMSVDQAVACLQLSNKSPGFSAERWLGVVTEISKIHKTGFVTAAAEIFINTPTHLFPPDWFSLCLPLVDQTHQESHAVWLSRVCRDKLRPDAFEPAVDYALTFLALIGSAPIVAQFVKRMIQAVSSTQAGVAVSALTKLGHLVSWESLLQVIGPSADGKLLIEALRQNDNSKARRLMKKLALALT